MDSLIGKAFGPYTILDRLGQGGMAVVYKGFQESLNRHVAIKVLRGELARDQQFIIRFRREALATAKLNHPNILHVYDAGFAHGVYYIVMDYAPGGTIKDLLAHGRLDVDRAVSIAAQVAEALDYAHQQGLVHRDVKPSNILLAGDGRPQLTDFGIAKALYETHQLTRTGTSIGTPEYMAPEQVQGQAVDGRTDIYALGVVLYEMLAGRVPFRASTPMAVVYKHVNETPPPLRSMLSDAPAWLEAVLDKALAKRAGDRYRRASEMAEALRQPRAPELAETRASGRRPAPPAEKRRRRTPPPRAARQKPRAARRPAQRRPAGGARILLAAIVILVMALLVGSVFLLLGDGDNGQSQPGTSAVITLVVTPEMVTRVVTSAPPVVTAAATPQPTVGSERDIPSLSADVTDLRFFASGYAQPPREERVYSRRFAQSEARYISYELNLEFPEPGRRLEFEVAAVYYNPDGSVLSEFESSHYLEADWTTSWHSKGWGWEEPGNWSVGTYQVELYVDGQLIASDSFEIY